MIEEEFKETMNAYQRIISFVGSDVGLLCH
jgi:hypothetical protein